MADLPLLHEGEVAWLVVVDDQNYGSAVALEKCVVVLEVIELDLELAVFIPLLVINDFDLDDLKRFTLLEVDRLMNSFIIFSLFSRHFLCAQSDFTLFTSLVKHLDIDSSAGLRHCVLEGLEAKQLVFLIRRQV